jgi:hypothetical protein
VGAISEWLTPTVYLHMGLLMGLLPAGLEMFIGRMNASPVLPPIIIIIIIIIITIIAKTALIVLSQSAVK